MISALGPTGVPVPRTLGLCTDESVNGAPFYVMSFVEGNIVRDERAAARLDGVEPRPGRRVPHPNPGRAPCRGRGRGRPGRFRPARRVHRPPAQAVARPVHPVDPGRTGGAGGGRTGSTSCWRRRSPNSRAGSSSTATTAWTTPSSTTQGNVRAILDWEICTLGDPLADLGLLMVYWAEPEDGDQALIGVAPTTLPGFARRSELLDRYAALTGRDVSGIAYYRAFGFWKLACILQGVHVRYAGGAAAGDRSGVDQFAAHVGQAGRTGSGRGGVPVIDRDPVVALPVRPAVGRAGRPAPDPSGHGGRPRRLGRRRDGRVRGHRRAAHLVSDHAGGHLRHRDADRPAGPPADRPPGGRGHHRAHLAGHPDGGGQGPGGRRHRVPHRSRAGLPLADVHRGGGGTGPGPAGAHRGRARCVSGAHTPYPAGPSGLDGPAAVGGPGRTGGHRARDARGTRRGAGGARGLAWASPGYR